MSTLLTTKTIETKLVFVNKTKEIANVHSFNDLPMTTNPGVFISDVASSPNHGRSTKFTPERIEQIKNLVERGTPREEIASIIGCSVGSLAVTCSRLGISLRRRYPPGFAPKRPPVAPSPAVVALAPAKPMNTEKPRASLVLRSAERECAVPISMDVVGKLAVEASFRGVSIGELVAEILQRHQ